MKKMLVFIVAAFVLSVSLTGCAEQTAETPDTGDKSVIVSDKPTESATAETSSSLLAGEEIENADSSEVPKQSSEPAVSYKPQAEADTSSETPATPQITENPAPKQEITQPPATEKPQQETPPQTTTTTEKPAPTNPPAPTFEISEYVSYAKSYGQGIGLSLDSNLVIYSHHMNNGTMFSDLCKYTDKDFYESHKTIRFDTLEDFGSYEIIAIFKTVAYSEQGFKYYHFVDAHDETEFDEYVSKCKALALYDTGITAEYGDKLITLSTCEYSQTNGRLVVVAKKIAE